jgi:hypothetical protein
VVKGKKRKETYENSETSNQYISNTFKKWAQKCIRTSNKSLLSGFDLPKAAASLHL